MEESCGRKWDIGHLQILLRREVRRNSRSILTRESLTSSDCNLWELRLFFFFFFFWRKTYMWSLGRPVLDTSYKENMSGRKVFNNKISSGEKFVFFSFLLLLLLKKVVMEAKLWAICKEGRRRAEAVCGKVRGGGGVWRQEKIRRIKQASLLTSMSSHLLRVWWSWEK